MKIEKCLTALVTPFRNGEIDEQAFQEFVEWQIDQGVHGLVPCGTTGESATLSDAEHQRVISLCVEAAGGRVPVVAGAGSNETVVSVRYAEHARSLGADAALVVTPYYNKPSQEGLYRHFEAVSRVGIPIFVYNIPGRSIVDISDGTMARISRLPNILGVKDATGDMERVQAYLDGCTDGFVQLSGDDPSVLGYMAHGGQGMISVGSNLAPRAYAAFADALASGDLTEARRLNARLAALHTDLFTEPSPAPAKYGLSLMGKMAPDVRLPIVECSDAAKARVRAAMERAGVEPAGVERAELP